MQKTKQKNWEKKNSNNKYFVISRKKIKQQRIKLSKYFMFKTL